MNNNTISVTDHHGNGRTKVVILAKFAKKVIVEDGRVMAICAIHPDCAYQTTNHLEYNEKTGEVGVSTLAAGYLGIAVDNIENACQWLNDQEAQSIFNVVEGVAKIRWEPADMEDVKNYEKMMDRGFELRAASLARSSGNGVPLITRI